MQVHTATSTALLEGLKDPQNQTVWSEFVSRHRPLILGYCARLGIARADAEDLAQEALLAFARAYADGKYDVQRGRLRAWLHGIANNVINNFRRSSKQRHERQADGGDGSGDLFARRPDAKAQEEIWEGEWRRSILRTALERARAEFAPSTFRAFELFACEGRAAEVVAAELGISRNAVYIAKHRVLQRLRDLQKDTEALWQ